MKRFLCLLAATLTLSLPAAAQDMSQGSTLPPLPAPVDALAKEGAQLRYLGRYNGLDGWITIRNGQEQYFYVMPDGKTFVMGLLFNDKGQMVTLNQIQALRREEGDTLDILTDDEFIDSVRPPSIERVAETDDSFKTPSERMYTNIEEANWVAIGSADAPHMYMIIDPQCPHCHDFLLDLKEPYIESGKLQLRLIPVGFREETVAQAAFLLASPNPQETLYRHLEGDKNALPVEDSVNQQGIQRNLAILQAWSFNATPLSVYRDRQGSVKILRGRARNMDDVMKELAPAS